MKKQKQDNDSVWHLVGQRLPDCKHARGRLLDRHTVEFHLDSPPAPFTSLARPNTFPPPVMVQDQLVYPVRGGVVRHHVTHRYPCVFLACGYVQHLWKHEGHVFVLTNAGVLCATTGFGVKGSFTLNGEWHVRQKGVHLVRKENNWYRSYMLDPNGILHEKDGFGLSFLSRYGFDSTTRVLTDEYTFKTAEMVDNQILDSRREFMTPMPDGTLFSMVRNGWCCIHFRQDIQAALGGCSTGLLPPLLDIIANYAQGLTYLRNIYDTSAVSFSSGELLSFEEADPGYRSRLFVYPMDGNQPSQCYEVDYGVAGCYGVSSDNRLVMGLAPVADEHD